MSVEDSVETTQGGDVDYCGCAYMHIHIFFVVLAITDGAFFDLPDTNWNQVFFIQQNTSNNGQNRSMFYNSFSSIQPV